MVCPEQKLDEIEKLESARLAPEPALSARGDVPRISLKVFICFQLLNGNRMHNFKTFCRMHLLCSNQPCVKMNCGHFANKLDTI